MNEANILFPCKKSPWFQPVKTVLRTTAFEENFPPNLNLTLTLIQTLTLSGGQFSSGATEDTKFYQIKTNFFE